MAASNGQSEDVNVDVYTAKGLLATGYRYLDVRTKGEFDEGHVEDALNIPYMFITEEGRLKNPDFLAQVSEVCKKSDKLVVGFEGVSNMEGGYSAWVDAGFAGENAEKQTSQNTFDSTNSESIKTCNHLHKETPAGPEHLVPSSSGFPLVPFPFSPAFKRQDAVT
ncbi:hypothetical protein Cgig2_014752 [Carnegiea gigantea]|uniref:Rhodanese domain-containing protein n=1 Tax=Carnegiea gigantea TaxID=171969 RepID=A0A9Q1L0D0_9CARY|nr:hypothetical protein Cgig2_014752 [Carnegiea gigantea]